MRVSAKDEFGAYTLGGVRDVWNMDKFSLGIGSDVTFYSKPAILDPIYGNHPISYRFFLRLRPSKMDMSRMPGMDGNPKTGEDNMPPKP